MQGGLTGYYKIDDFFDGVNFYEFYEHEGWHRWIPYALTQDGVLLGYTWKSLTYAINHLDELIRAD